MEIKSIVDVTVTYDERTGCPSQTITTYYEPKAADAGYAYGPQRKIEGTSQWTTSTQEKTEGKFVDFFVGGATVLLLAVLVEIMGQFLF